jgi:hypothetical protein
MPWMEILMLAIGVALIVTMICGGQRAYVSAVRSRHPSALASHSAVFATTTCCSFTHSSEDVSSGIPVLRTGDGPL